MISLKNNKEIIYCQDQTMPYQNSTIQNMKDIIIIGNVIFIKEKYWELYSKATQYFDYDLVIVGHLNISYKTYLILQILDNY